MTYVVPPKLKRDRSGAVDLRALARDTEGCMVRGPTCTDGPTALLHIRVGNPGVGRKPCDLNAVKGCNACHQYIGDGSHPDVAGDVRRALCEWHAYLWEALELRLK